MKMKKYCSRIRKGQRRKRGRGGDGEGGVKGGVEAG